MFINYKNTILFLSFLVCVSGCNAFAVPAVFISTALVGNIDNKGKNATRLEQSSNGIRNLAISSEAQTNHISGVSNSEHLSGSVVTPNNISGTTTDHISGAEISQHISGTFNPAHLSGSDMRKDHISGD